MTHLNNTLATTVESCTRLPLNAGRFAIDSPRCLDRARVAAWFEDVKPREEALDAAINALAGGVDSRSVLDQLVALVPLDTSGVTPAQLAHLAQWVAERVSGADSSLRNQLEQLFATPLQRARVW